MPVPIPRVEVEVFSEEVNHWIVRTPGRQFPAVVIQGDTLSALFADAQSIVDHAGAFQGNDPELLEKAKDLRDAIWSRLRQYEEVLGANGIALPYSRDAWPK